MTDGISFNSRGLQPTEKISGASAGDNVTRSITTIYEPIQRRMLEFEMELDGVIEDAPPDLRDRLAHALKGGGKRLRPALVLLSGSLYPGKPAPLISMALGYELLHTATLVHDDTIDNAITRRGMLTVNRLWGNSNAVVLGDYLCGCSAFMTAQTGSLRAMQIFSRALADICGGAIAEHVAGPNTSRQEYFVTISRKTASLFCAATESGAVLSRAPGRAVRAIKTFGYNLGMAFQTIDDIHDFASDMSRGGVALPAILLLEQSENRWVADLLDKDPPTALDILIEMVEDSCVLEDCYRIAEDFCCRACNALDTLPESAVRESLRDLVQYIMDQRP
jgi:octaprenyl-diphosphate synthase